VTSADNLAQFVDERDGGGGDHEWDDTHSRCRRVNVEIQAIGPPVRNKPRQSNDLRATLSNLSALAGRRYTVLPLSGQVDWTSHRTILRRLLNQVRHKPHDLRPRLILWTLCALAVAPTTPLPAQHITLDPPVAITEAAPEENFVYDHDAWPDEGTWHDFDDSLAAPSGYGLPWTWQLLPEGLIYRAYLADAKESRFGSVWFYERDLDWLWDVTLGGHVGLLRYGTQYDFRPEGFQLDIEGAAFPRLDLESDRDLVSSDFRFGVPFTWGFGQFAVKFAYYHLSSHLGDEYLRTNPGARRINYSRDALVVGVDYRPLDDVRLYGEAGWAFFADEGTDPWEFRLGAEWAPGNPNLPRGGPFAAAGAHLREDVDYGGNLILQAGWAWRSLAAGRLLRVGAQYFNGKSLSFQFVDEHEEQIGVGLWYDY